MYYLEIKLYAQTETLQYCKIVEIPQFVLLFSHLPDIVRKCVGTMSPLRLDISRMFMFIAREIKKKKKQ